MNNPPAFPGPIDDIRDERSGMTLRDYFAAHSLPIMIGRGDLNHDEIAAHAFKIADAMLKAREQ